MRSRCLILTAAVLLCACGAKGPLYLPPANTPATQGDLTPKPAPGTTPAPAPSPAATPRS